MKRPTQLLGVDDYATINDGIYSEVSPTQAIAKTSSNEEITLSQCPAYDRSLTDGGVYNSSLTETGADFNYSQNAAYNGHVIASHNSQTSLDSSNSLSHCNAYNNPAEHTGNDGIAKSEADDFAIYQCPAYKCNENVSDDVTYQNTCGRLPYEDNQDMISRESAVYHYPDSPVSIIDL